MKLVLGPKIGSKNCRYSRKDGISDADISGIECISKADAGPSSGTRNGDIKRKLKAAAACLGARNLLVRLEAPRMLL